MLCFLCDFPERCAVTSILSYVGRTTRRWSYSGIYCSKKLPSCLMCFNKCITNITSLNIVNDFCGRCCDWNMDNKNKLLIIAKPNNYPINKHSCSPQEPKGRDIKIRVTQFWKINIQTKISCTSLSI